MYVCTYVCMCIYCYFSDPFKCYVIELIEIANKSELSQRSFLSFSKAVNREKRLPSQSRKKSMDMFLTGG